MRNIIFYLVLFFLFFAIGTAVGQFFPSKIDRIFNKIENNKFQKAKRINSRLEHSSRKNKLIDQNPVVYQLNLVKLNLHSFSYYNAYQDINTTISKYFPLDQAGKELLKVKYNISLESLYALRESIALHINSDNLRPPSVSNELSDSIDKVVGLIHSAKLTQDAYYRSIDQQKRVLKLPMANNRFEIFFDRDDLVMRLRLFDTSKININFTYYSPGYYFSKGVDNVLQTFKESVDGFIKESKVDINDSIIISIEGSADGIPVTEELVYTSKIKPATVYAPYEERLSKLFPARVNETFRFENEKVERSANLVYGSHLDNELLGFLRAFYPKQVLNEVDGFKKAYFRLRVFTHSDTGGQFRSSLINIRMKNAARVFNILKTKLGIIDGSMRIDSLSGVLNSLKSIGKAKNDTAPFLNQNALVIGISDYKYLQKQDKDVIVINQSLYDLNYASKDAFDFTNFIQDNKYSGIWRITSLTDEYATQSNIYKHLTDICDQSNDKDLIYIYFSGHGITALNTNDVFLLPYDYNPETNEPVLRYSDLFDIVLNARCKNIIIFIDACHSSARIEVIIRNYIEKIKLKADKNLVVMLSCGDDEWSCEGKITINNGVYTYFLLKALKDPGSGADIDKNGKIDLEELQTYLVGNVPRLASQECHRSQSPKEIRLNPLYSGHFNLSNFNRVRK